MSVELSKQKLDIDLACGFLQKKINEMTQDLEILKVAVKYIDKENLNVLEDNSVLAQDARSIMFKLSTKVYFEK